MSEVASESVVCGRSQETWRKVAHTWRIRVNIDVRQGIWGRNQARKANHPNKISLDVWRWNRPGVPKRRQPTSFTRRVEIQDPRNIIRITVKGWKILLILLKRILQWDGGVDWIYLAWDRDRWRAVVNAGNFLIRWVTVSFSGRTLLHGVISVCLCSLFVYVFAY
jgi:hypothetical protein